MKRLTLILGLALIATLGVACSSDTDKATKSFTTITTPVQQDAWDRLPTWVDRSGWSRQEVNAFHAGDDCLTAWVVDFTTPDLLVQVAEERGTEETMVGIVRLMMEEGACGL